MRWIIVLVSLGLAGCPPIESDEPPPAGDSYTPGDSAPAGDPMAQWTCPPFFYGDYGSCDCGCGIPDIDCPAGVGCTQNGCQDPACGVCWEDGYAIDCVEIIGPPGWECDVESYGDEWCDCGCGIVDIDCQGDSCVEVGCNVPGCEFCNTDAGWMECDLIDAWHCDYWYYESMDGCDCGCGLIDPDCDGPSCALAECSAAGCDACYDAEGNDIGCD